MKCQHRNCIIPAVPPVDLTLWGWEMGDVMNIETFLSFYIALHHEAIQYHSYGVRAITSQSNDISRRRSTSQVGGMNFAVPIFRVDF